jgi:DNA-binding transcriptional MerR regulator
MGYTVAQVKEIADKLRALPAVEPPAKDLTKSDAVKMLLKEIESLQKRGYTLEQIATSLKGEGLDISTPTLKSYLQKTKAEAKAKAEAKTEAKAKPTKKDTSKTLSTSPTLPEGGSSPVPQVEVTGDNKKKDSSISVPRPDSDDL